VDIFFKFNLRNIRQRVLIYSVKKISFHTLSNCTLLVGNFYCCSNFDELFRKGIALCFLSMMFHYVEELSSDAKDSDDESDDEADDVRNGKSQIDDRNSGKIRNSL